MTNDEIVSRIKTILDAHARLGVPAANLGIEDDLYDAGMISHASVEVMLALEDAFDIEFPDHMLRKEVFECIAAIKEAVSELVKIAA